jgi:ABC-2 type transport system permease protein
MRRRFGLISNFTTIWALAKAFTIRYFRDKVALFFTFLFPIIFLVVFGTIFGGNDAPSFKTALINHSTTEFSTQFVDNLKQTEVFEIVTDVNFDEAKEQMGRGEIDGILELPENFGQIEQDKPTGTIITYYDQGDEQLASTFQAVLQAVLDDVNKQFIEITPPFKLEARPLQTANLSRLDYLLPGLIGFSILSLAIFSMSEGFTADKKNGSLRRMRVAPIRPWQVIIATALNRVFVGILTVAVMFIVGLIFFKFNMRGDYFSFITFSIIGTICLFGFGMAIAGWARDANQAAPLSNLVSFPMMFLSGVFFPVFLMPEWLQKVTQFIPLTPVVEGLRRIMTEGQTLLDLGPQLLIIGAWSLIIYMIAFKTFRWE